ncbi:Uncharacterised protein r2_g919 [Pycnogonum litorale]
MEHRSADFTDWLPSYGGVKIIVIASRPLDCRDTIHDHNRLQSNAPAGSCQPDNNQRPTLHLNRRTPTNTTQYSARESSRLQKRAIRKVLQPNQVAFTGSKSVCETYFQNDSPALADSSQPQLLLNDLMNFPPGDDAELEFAITPDEIRQRLLKASNTSPGEDRIEYRHLKLLDTSGAVLSLLYNTIFRHQRVPRSWKTAHTVLIYKKGDQSDPSNFRPIALLSVLYKLLSGVIASRLQRWCRARTIMSAGQKGFLSGMEGCMEHSFLTEAVRTDAKRNHKNMEMLWLDLQNAFGSIPHEAMMQILSHIGVPPTILSLVLDVYCSATATYQTGDGPTEPVVMTSGVRQGDPLSPILFNICLEPLLRSVSRYAEDKGFGYSVHGELVSVLALADDICILGASRAATQQLLDAIVDAAQIVGLIFRPDKCCSFSYARGKPSSSDYALYGSAIGSLLEGDTYRYLGVPQGFDYPRGEAEKMTTSMEGDIELLKTSLLAPWQKLDAFKTAIQSRLRATYIQKNSLKHLKQSISRFARDICSLPDRSTAAYFYSDKSAGGLGLQDVTSEPDIQVVVQATRMLTCPDQLVSTVATKTLRSVVKRAFKKEPDGEQLNQYLSGAPIEGASTTGDIRNLFSRCRAAARRLCLNINFDEANLKIDFTSRRSETFAATPWNAARLLRKGVRQSHADKLKSLPDQGKFARGTSIDDFGLGSHFHVVGKGIRFCDWRFIHKARLNLLPVHSVVRKWKPGLDRCRRCGGVDETLPHVTNHCPALMVPIRRRHDAIVDRLRRALPRSLQGQAILDQHHPEDTDPRRRPDIVIADGNKTTVVDVCLPFENGADALPVAAARKAQKITESLVTSLRQRGRDAVCLPFVVGALGTWYPENSKVLRRLGVAKRYIPLFRRLCIADAIRSTRDVYVEFICGHRQY